MIICTDKEHYYYYYKSQGHLSAMKTRGAFLGLKNKHEHMMNTFTCIHSHTRVYVHFLRSLGNGYVNCLGMVCYCTVPSACAFRIRRK